MFFHYWKFAKNAPFVFKDIQGVSFAFFNVAIMLFGATACNVSRYEPITTYANAVDDEQKMMYEKYVIDKKVREMLVRVQDRVQEQKRLEAQVE